MYINKIPSEEQREGVKFCRTRNKGILCYATGTGKTLIMLMDSMLKLEHDELNGVVIVGTNSALKSIRTELWETFREKPLDIKRLARGKKGISLVPYTQVSKVCDMIPQGRYMLILDEYHKVKSPKTATTKACTKFRKKFISCYGFTATPIMKDFRDLFELVKWMNPLILGTWEAFCKEYTLFYRIPTGKGFDILKPYRFRNFEKLKRVLEPIMISYFPDYDIQYEERPCELTDVESYRKVIKEALAPTGDEKRDKALPMLAIRACKNHVAISKNKMQKLLDTVREVIQYGVIVYCDEYKTLNPVYKVLTHFGFEVLKYTGKQTTRQNDKSMDEFVSNPKNKILLISRVAGASLNLQATNRLIMFDMPSHIGAVQQLMGRVARKYSEYDSYYIYLLITKGTVEEYWFKYITMYAEPLKKLFNNGLVPQGIPTYDEFLKKQLINDTVWYK